MISVSVWFPVRMPRSVDTSKITACVGMRSPICCKTTCKRASAARLARRTEADSPATGWLWIARPSIFAKLDLPDPKKPETQTPTPSCGLFGVLR